MPEHPLDYETPRDRKHPPFKNRAALAACIVVVVTLIVNTLLLASANANPGLASVIICLLVSPACNGVLLATSLACLPLFVKRSSDWAIRGYAIISIVLPLGAMIYNVHYLSAMPRY
jgi:hypothetical protein